MRTSTKILLLLLFFLVFCLPSNGVYAFGAGNIPSFAYMEGKAFRHGDIEDILAELVKKQGGGMAMLGGLIGKGGGSKFSGIDIKRVYFGNWLRDYSQAVDIAGLQKLPLQTILNLCMALGFLAHGYATNEFEVTKERLGVYLPTEHIDNPKGYGDGKDPRQFDPRLRGPVDPRELEVDPRTGMKNYIANEDGSWDTSKGLLRRTIEKCIQHGRAQRVNGQKADLYESYRLLGTLLHTLEDFAAHSNFCELSLYSMGYTQVFLHVGDRARIQAPGGKWVAPLVTGTFGSSDFTHSLLGEATDHISQASVTDLNAELNKANAKAASGTRGPGDSGSTFSLISELLSSIPAGGGSDMKGDVAQLERIRADNASGAGKPADQLSPQELHAQLWAILSLRDRIVKKISHTIEKIPGLGPLIEKLMENISVFVFTTLEPLLKPLMKTATTGLMAASGEVIDTHDQYEVFNIPTADDPTHSFLSKDHFNLILNEPAGNLAKIVVRHSVNLIVKAWDDPGANVRSITEEILLSMFHPDFHNQNSIIQREMMKYMYSWINGLGNHKNSVLERLTKDAVRNHKNIRLGGEGGAGAAEGSYGQNMGHQAQADIQNYISSHIPGNLGGNTSGGHSHGHGGQQSSGSPFAPSYGSSSSGPSLPNIPGLNMQGLSAFGKMAGLTREMEGQQGYSREAPYPGNAPPASSPYAPSYPSSAPEPPSFPGMPHHGSSSAYAPSYASPPPAQPAPFGFSSGTHGGPGPGFPGAHGGNYQPPYGEDDNGGGWAPPPVHGGDQSPYGFSPPGFPGSPQQPPGGQPGFPGAPGYGEYRQW